MLVKIHYINGKGHTFFLQKSPKIIHTPFFIS